MCCDPPLDDSTNQPRRKNGWACPWHCQQVLAWLLILIVGVVYFTTVPPGFPPIIGQLPCYIGVGACMLLMIIFLAIATTINPADPATLASNNRVTMFDRSKHAHVIENYYCNICRTNVDPTSKHCSVCNKCVINFDHHCKWLNSCVGARNYRYFILLVVFGFATSLFIFASSLVQFIAYFVQQPSDTSILQQFRSYYTSFYASQSAAGTTGATPQASDAQFAVLYINCVYYVWLTIVGLVSLVALVSIGLLLHLLCFHIYLCNKHITTYAYIRHQRAVEESREKGLTERPGSPRQYALGGNPCCPQQRVQDSPTRTNVSPSRGTVSTFASNVENGVAVDNEPACTEERNTVSRISFNSAAVHSDLERGSGVSASEISPVIETIGKKKHPRNWGATRTLPQPPLSSTITIDNYSPKGYNVATDDEKRESIRRLEVRLSRPVQVMPLPGSTNEPTRQSNLSVLPPVAPTRGNKKKRRSEDLATEKTQSDEDVQSEASLEEIPVAEFQRTRQMNAYNGLAPLPKISPRHDPSLRAFTNTGYSQYLEV